MKRLMSASVMGLLLTLPAAVALGVPLVVVSFGYSETPARELAPDILIEHFDDLPAACERLLLAARPPRGADA